MKKMYQIPQLQVVIMDKADIITDSGELPDDPVSLDDETL